MNQTTTLKKRQLQPLNKEELLINQNYVDQSVIENIKSQFQSSNPNQHLELNNFLNERIAYRLLKRFPHVNMFKRKKSDKKMIENNFDLLDPVFNKLKKYFLTEDFQDWIGEITGIDGLLTPHEGKNGFGICLSKNGYFSNIQTEENIYKKLNLHKKIKLILYLNDDWNQLNEGELEFWDKEVKNLSKKLNHSLIKLSFLKLTKIIPTATENYI